MRESAVGLVEQTSLIDDGAGGHPSGHFPAIDHALCLDLEAAHFYEILIYTDWPNGSLRDTEGLNLEAECLCLSLAFSFAYILFWKCPAFPHL